MSLLWWLIQTNEEWLEYLAIISALTIVVFFAIGPGTPYIQQACPAASSYVMQSARTSCSHQVRHAASRYVMQL